MGYLPKTEEGNYSMFLWDEPLFKVKSWIKDDLRTHEMGAKELLKDIEKFRQYEQFDVGSIKPVKYKKELQFLIDN